MTSLQCCHYVLFVTSCLSLVAEQGIVYQGGYYGDASGTTGDQRR